MHAYIHIYSYIFIYGKRNRQWQGGVVSDGGIPYKSITIYIYILMDLYDISHIGCESVWNLTTK